MALCRFGHFGYAFTSLQSKQRFLIARHASVPSTVIETIENAIAKALIDGQQLQTRIRILLKQK